MTLGLLVLTGLLSAGATTASASTRPANQILSNEFTFTRWAYVERAARVYSKPSVWSHVVSQLTWYTEDGFPSIYLLLEQHRDSRGREWVDVRIPGRPNGRTGWVLRSALGSFNLTHQAIIVNRATLHMYFYDNGRRIWSAPVGIGAPSMPTPPGRFWINEKFTLPAANPYYPYAFGTTDYSTLTDWPGGGVVGIHGPYGAPWWAIPGQISHGCVRLRIPDDFWLGSHAHLGDPVWIK